MSVIVTRAGKGSALTNAEVDANFTNLNADKLELSGGTMTGGLNLGTNTLTTTNVNCGSGAQLIFTAGESSSQVTGLASEVVYAVAEGGLQVISSPDNWGTGWATRNTATICNSAGDSTFPGNVSSTSDERLKTNWKPLADDFVEQLAGLLHGVYDRIDSGVTQVGVGAQSLQAFLPEAVIRNEDGYLTVNYGNAALAATVSLAKRVVQQEERIKQLEAKLARLVDEG